MVRGRVTASFDRPPWDRQRLIAAVDVDGAIILLALGIARLIGTGRARASQPGAVPLDALVKVLDRVGGDDGIVKRTLLTGMSGTGKSTVARELAARGYKAVDVGTAEWSELVDMPGHPGLSAAEPGKDWVWREDRVQRLLATEDADILFLSGCAPNQVKFYPQFDHIVLLRAPIPVMVDRLATRTTNAYGKQADELKMVLRNTRTIEPLLRTVASLEVDTSAPVPDVIEAILNHVRP